MGAIALSAVNAFGGEFSYQNILVGERAMGLGGAMTALGADTSSAWYNPAGLAFLRGSNFSLQVGVYGTTSDSTAAGGGLLPIENGQFVTFPSTAVVVKEVGGERHRLGFAVLTPTFEHRSLALSASDVTFQTQSGPRTFGRYSLLQEDRDTEVWLGPTYAFRLHPRLSLGATMFFTVRKRELSTNLFGGTGGQIAETRQLDVGMLNVSTSWLLGLRAELYPGLFFGATFRTPNVRLYGSAVLSIVSFNLSGGAPRTAPVDGDSYYNLPWRASFGVGYERSRNFAFGADVTLHGSVDRYQAVGSAPGVPRVLSEVAKESVVNVNVGGEYYLGGVVPLRAGFFTNRTAQGPLTSEGRGYAGFGVGGVLGGEGDGIDQYGFTFGVGLETGATSLGVAVSYVFGTGTTVLGSATGERSLRSLHVGIAGSYAF